MANSRAKSCQCGNLMSRTSRQCKECYDIYLELVWMGCANKPTFHQHEKADDPRAKCPDCGGRKDVRAQRCRKCRGKVDPPSVQHRFDKCKCGRNKMKKNVVCWRCAQQRDGKRHPWRGPNQVRGGRYS